MLDISAEPLSVNSAIIVITLQLREIIRYVPTQSGNLNINGILYEREPLQIPAIPKTLNSMQRVSDESLPIMAAMADIDQIVQGVIDEVTPSIPALLEASLDRRIGAYLQSL
ncbi:MAG: hypothetical protein BWK73_04845 [Thiothrix lacustris]|uniref:Uncharacterized protein n=1 Tax=Thiothrix lacustris TaxID=525917 RepID=A0A1Y1QXW7_9GAMM|nr:MAG: hypothetical protein BWK73_04845 [Thiothrix lacustris]